MIVAGLAMLVAACQRPQPVAADAASPPAYAPSPASGFVPVADPSIQAFFGMQFCTIHHKANGVITGPDTIFLGPDGQPQRLSAEWCEQENVNAQREDEHAFLRSMADARRANQEAQQKHAAVVEQIIREEAARGYKRVTVKDLYLDAKLYAANQTKLAVPGFYKANGPHNQRLYDSYGDFMMHMYQSVEALNVGLITEDGSRALRETLLRCVAGCRVTILGRADQCVLTNAFGATSHDVCLVAEDLERADE